MVSVDIKHDVYFRLYMVCVVDTFFVTGFLPERQRGRKNVPIGYSEMDNAGI